MLENNRELRNEEFGSDIDTSDYFSQSQSNSSDMGHKSSQHFYQNEGSFPMSSQGSSNSQRINIEPESQSLFHVFNNRPSQSMFEKEQNDTLPYHESQNQPATRSQDNRLMVNHRAGRFSENEKSFHDSSLEMFAPSQNLMDYESQSLLTLNGSQPMDLLCESQFIPSQNGYQSSMPLNGSQPFKLQHRNQSVAESQSLANSNVNQSLLRHNEHQRIIAPAWNQPSVPSYRVDTKPSSQGVIKTKHDKIFNNRTGREPVLQTSNDSQSFVDNTQSYIRPSSQSMLLVGTRQVVPEMKQHDVSMRTGRSLMMDDSAAFDRSRSVFSRPLSVDPIMQGNYSYF